MSYGSYTPMPLLTPADADAIVAHLATKVQGGDIVCVFSNGGFGDIHQKLLTRLGRR